LHTGATKIPARAWLAKKSGRRMRDFMVQVINQEMGQLQLMVADGSAPALYTPDCT
jgi:hypothetical protein